MLLFTAGQKSSPYYCGYCAELHAGMLIVRVWETQAGGNFYIFIYFESNSERIVPLHRRENSTGDSLTTCFSFGDRTM